MDETNDAIAAAAPHLPLPPFPSTDAAPWFLRIEALFRLRAIYVPLEEGRLRYWGAAYGSFRPDLGLAVQAE